MHAQVPRDAGIERRVDRIVQALLVETPLAGKYSTATLSERMRYYHAPGVSMAVINHFRLEWARGFGRDRYSASVGWRDRLVPVAPDSFAIPVLNGTVSFAADKRRRITVLLLEHEGSTIAAKRESPR